MNFKVTTFLIMVVLIIIKYYKVFDINTFWIIGVFCIWFISVYFSIHYKNKEDEIPKPVYLTNPSTEG